MSLQQAFDDMVAHLRKQGCKALEPNPGNPTGQSCRYRTKDGKKCAIGGILPDEYYFPAMEGRTINTLELCIFRDYLDKKYGPHENYQLYNDMQNIHDRHNVENWEDGFKKCAEEHGLTYSPPNGLTHL